MVYCRVNDPNNIIKIKLILENTNLVYLIKQILTKLRKIKDRYYKAFPKRIYNLDLRKEHIPKLRRSALFSYIVFPFLISQDNPRYYRHINIWRAPEIVKILNYLGYKVDVVDYTDDKFSPKKDYDLFIGHGHTNFIKIASLLPVKTQKIFFATGNDWQYYNQVLIERYSSLTKRKQVCIQPKNIIKFSQKELLKFADGIIAIGGDFSKQTFNKYNYPIFMINNTALFDPAVLDIQRDFEKGRNHFLFFAGADNVRKGLDLLLEAFVQLNRQLWVCTFIDSQFLEIFSNELNNYSNIHLIGNIIPRSQQFYKLIKKCNFVILPSCSEGQPHSVIECMNYGLIPIVSKACSINVENFGEIIDRLDIKSIINIIEKCAGYSPEQCRNKSEKVREVVRKKYSAAEFHQNFSNSITSLTN